MEQYKNIIKEYDETINLKVVSSNNEIFAVSETIQQYLIVLQNTENQTDLIILYKRDLLSDKYLSSFKSYIEHIYRNSYDIIYFKLLQEHKHYMISDFYNKRIFSIKKHKFL